MHARFDVTPSQRTQVENAVHAAWDAANGDPVTFQESANRLWDLYKQEDGENYARRGLLNSWCQLYVYASAAGTQLTCVYIKGTNSYNGNFSRTWQVFVPYASASGENLETMFITGYLLDIGIGKRSRTTGDSFALSIQGYADDIAQQLHSKLFHREGGEYTQHQYRVRHY